MKNQPVVDKNSRKYQLQQINNARGALLSILLMTLINLVMAVLDTGRYFLFSASVPYYLTLLSKGFENNFVDGAWPVNGPMTITALVISAVILAVYLLCWLLSKKRGGWITVAMVLFLLDTLALVLIIFYVTASPISGILDVLFHLWACWLLIQGFRANKKLKTMPWEPSDEEPARNTPEPD